MTTLRPSKISFLALCSLLTLAALAFAGPHRAQAEQQARAIEPGVWLVVSHKVYDYAQWKREHDRTASVKRASYGWQGGELFTVDGDRNHVMVMERFASRERAEAFAGSRELTYEMAASGVSSQPEVRIVHTSN